MSHGLDNCQPVLRRWAAHSETPLPKDWNAWVRNNQLKAVEIANADPQLVSLLDGTAAAGLRADALGGQFSSVAPKAPSEADVRRQRIAEIEAADPFGLKSPKNKNLTLALELNDLAPDRFEALEKQATPQVDPRERRRAQQFQQHQLNQLSLESLKAKQREMFQQHWARQSAGR